MAALLLQYVKLIMLFLMVGSVIALSHFGSENRNGSGLAAARHKHSSAKTLRIPTHRPEEAVRRSYHVVLDTFPRGFESR